MKTSPWSSLRIGALFIGVALAVLCILQSARGTDRAHPGIPSYIENMRDFEKVCAELKKVRATHPMFEIVKNKASSHLSLMEQSFEKEKASFDCILVAVEEPSKSGDKNMEKAVGHSQEMLLMILETVPYDLVSFEGFYGGLSDEMALVLYQQVIHPKNNVIIVSSDVDLSTFPAARKALARGLDDPFAKESGFAYLAPWGSRNSDKVILCEEGDIVIAQFLSYLDNDKVAGSQRVNSILMKLRFDYMVAKFIDCIRKKGAKRPALVLSAIHRRNLERLVGEFQLQIKIRDTSISR
jgi:hypothetical protein